MIYWEEHDRSQLARKQDPRKIFIIVFVLFTLLGFGIMSYQLYQSLKLQLLTEKRLEQVYSQGFIEGYEQALKDRQRRNIEKHNR